jgi:hypothetical protein
MPAAPVFVLGMHRSGTSCLAGCLEAAGLHLGSVNTAAPFNRKGNRERPDVMALNDAVLADAGARWDAPPEGDPAWGPDQAAARDGLLARFETEAEGSAWGLKDPRTLLTLKGWTAAVQPRFVGTFRRPDAVAASLMRRAEAWGAPMERARAFDLWRAYNERLCAVRRTQVFPIVRYDQPEIDYAGAVTRIATELDLPAPEKAAAFHAADLRNEATTGDIPKALADLWEELMSYAD